MTREGVMLHAKHALMPNNLGYCGPDEKGKILEHLHNSSLSEGLLSTLKEFEAAYPFVRMIAESTRRLPFDYKVTEAYWIGNSLLDKVEPAKFFEFSHGMRGSHISTEEAKVIFRQLGPSAKPHHTFYVLGMYGRANGSPSSEKKILTLMDSCRISWGRVLTVKDKTLVVERSPLVVENDMLKLASPVRREILYDRAIAPFQEVKEGDWVSIHWNFASERLKSYQLENLKAYTTLDIQATNSFARSREWKKLK